MSLVKFFWEDKCGIKVGVKQSGLMFSGHYVAKAFLFMYDCASKQIRRGEFIKANFGLKRWISPRCPIVRKKRERDRLLQGAIKEKPPQKSVFLSSDPAEPNAVGEC